MLRSALAITLCALMAVPTQGAEQAPLTVQEQIGEIPAGSIVEVKTNLKKMKKVRGRLGTVTNEGFEIQVAKGQTIENVRLSFADVKSIAETSQHKRTHPAILILAGVGVALAVVFTIIGLRFARSGE